jgi:hypothetical protein
MDEGVNMKIIQWAAVMLIYVGLALGIVIAIAAS